MTIEETIKKRLFDCGMFEEEAAAVFDEVKKVMAEPMKDRWHEPTDDYPKSLLVVVWMTAKACALKWIDANCPQAWYRPVFADGDTP